MKRRLAAHLFVALAGLLSYWGVWEFDFVSYDDPDYIAQNPVVQRGLSVEGIRWALSTSHAANWHPLTWMSLQTMASIAGASSAVAHITSLLLHLVASALVLQLFLRIGIPAVAASILAALFAAHPAHVESVAWVSEHKDVLSACFGLGSLLCWLRFGQCAGRGFYLASLGLLGLGLLAKPMLVSWPALFLLLNRWPLRRTTPFARQLWEISPALGLSLGAAGATMWAQSAGGAVVTGYELGLLPRLGNALVSLWRYPGLLAWPHDLSFLYPHPDLTSGAGGTPFWQIVIAAAGCACVALAWRRLAPMGRAGILFYLLTLLPVLGIVQVGPQSHADRYSYLPSIGLLLLLGLLLRNRSWLPRAAGIAAVVVCAWLARAQAEVWRDDDALYGHALRVNPNNWLAAGNYAGVLEERGEIERAEQLYRSALAQRPDDATSLYNLGTLYLNQGRFADAETELTRALRANPEHADALNNLSQIRARQGDHAGAVELLLRAMETRPNNPDIEVNLADSLRRVGRRVEAIERIRGVMDRHPRHARAMDVLARIHFAEDPSTALSHAERASAIEPQNPVYIETLARIQHRLGLLAEARLNCNRGLELARALGQSRRVSRLIEFQRQLSTKDEAEQR